MTTWLSDPNWAGMHEVDVSRAVAAGLQKRADFAALKLAIVVDPAVADAVLEVGHTFAWDYPFSVKHQNTSIVLTSGKGSGPFSGPAGATSVASEFVKLLQPYRVVLPQPTPQGK